MTDQTLLKGYFEFPQNGNFVVLLRNQEMPVLGDEVLKLLATAKSNADETDGWAILPSRAKIALVKEQLLKLILRARKAPFANKEELQENARGYLEYTQKVEPHVWEALEFLDYWVLDVYPFRDKRPDSELS
jgi:hypothetical protein